MRWWILLALAGCTATGGQDTQDTAGDETGSPDDTADTDPPANADELALRAAIAGEIGMDAALHEIAWRGGLPVHTDADTWLFVVRAGGAWSLAGDANGWSPAAMTQGDAFSWIEVAVPDPAGSGYKFVDGSGGFHADQGARSYTYDGFGELSYVAPPTDRHRIDRWPAFAGRGLLPRDVRVYVPPGAGPWPVLYMHDGQNLFAPDAIWGGWRMQDAAATVGAPVLIVGVDNTADRHLEYPHTVDRSGSMTVGGKGDAYAALVHEDLRPHIEEVYGSTGLDGVMGSSFGGLASLYLAHLHPDDYEFVGSLSGSLWLGKHAEDNPMMEELWTAAGVRHPVLYVDSGGDDGGDGCTDPDGDGFPEDDPNDSDGYCATRQFADAMGALGLEWDVQLFHWWEEGAAHDEAAWAARVHRPLGLFVGLE